MAMAVWEQGDLALEEGGSKEVWRRVVARRFGEEWGMDF